MDTYYNWEEILKEFNDNDLFNIIYDRNSSKERREVAEKILLQQNLIKKDESGKYNKELIEPKYLNFAAYNLRNKSKEETISELINRGLNEASSYRLVDYCIKWREKQKKKHKIWKILFPISLILFLIIEFVFKSEAGLIFPVINTILLGIYMPSSMNFRQIKIFKVL